MKKRVIECAIGGAVFGLGLTSVLAILAHYL